MLGVVTAAILLVFYRDLSPRVRGQIIQQAAAEAAENREAALQDERVAGFQEGHVGHVVTTDGKPELSPLRTGEDEALSVLRESDESARKPRSLRRQG